MAKLLVNESAGSREFELVDAEAHIGRELDNSVRIADPSISRHHAVVRRTATGYEVQDLQSSNGVLLNGSRVQTAPLQDGDRITLGQIQLTFLDPQTDISATVAVSKADLPAAPLGTMRMSADQMAQIHGAPPPAPEPAPSPSDAATGPHQTQDAPRPKLPPPPPKQDLAPTFGQFTNPGISGASMSANPAPEFLQPYLPPVPDDAQPTGERGDFMTRLVALLIDAGLGIALYIPFFILSFVPVLGCLTMLALPFLGLALLVFQLWCMVTFKATIGKKIMKLRIVREADPAAPLDWGVAILRLLGHMVNSMLFSLPYLMILGKDRKGLQDIFSGSIVIKVDR